MPEPSPVVPQPPPKWEPNDAAPDPLPPDAMPINVEGTKLAPPSEGFGKLWHKRYWIRLEGVDVSPETVIAEWRTRYGEFWPHGNVFYRPARGLRPGEVALGDLEMPGGTRLSTGVMVVEVNDTSFRFVTPQGHTFSGDITFSAHRDGAATIAQIDILLRPSDPLYELGMPIGGHWWENRFWRKTLQNVATYFGATGTAEMSARVIDRRRQWRKATNVVHNAYIRTMLYMLTRPFRLLAGKLRPGSATT